MMMELIKHIASFDHGTYDMDTLRRFNIAMEHSTFCSMIYLDKIVIVNCYVGNVDTCIETILHYL